MTVKRETAHRARTVLAGFLLTFMTVRIIVFLIMSRRLPDLYLHLGGTHIHHLNYGIFLLAGVGGYLLFKQATEGELTAVAVAYGVGMALTFDEFGMWLHLGGSYWQRASFDAIAVVAAVLGLIAFAPSLKRFRPHNWILAAILAVALGVFFSMLMESFKYAGRIVGPRLHKIETTAPK
jgi:hypothetical protein